MDAVVNKKVGKALCVDAKTFSIGKLYGLNCGDNRKQLIESFNINWMNSIQRLVCINQKILRQHVDQKNIVLCKDEKSCVKVPASVTIESGNCEDKCIYVEVN